MRNALSAFFLLFGIVVVPPAALGHGGEDHGHDPAPPPVAGGTSGPSRLADGSLFVPKPVQHDLGLRTQRLRVADLAATLELNGTVVADPDAGGRVQAPFAGTLMPGPQGMPVPGRKVRKGETLAWLRPVAAAIERGNQRAQLAELEAQLAIAEARARRYAQLDGAIPRKEIEAANIDVDALRKRRAAVAASIDAAEPLRAPAAGVISAASVVAGQIVDAREILFEIVDPRRLAVEALAYDPALAADIREASALAGRTPLELTFVGGGRQLREQALPLLFRIRSEAAPLAVGQSVTVVARTARAMKGMAVPRAALTKVSAGGTAVWVHVEAERYALRPVRQQPLDAGHVAVSEGLSDGDRVVVEGANLLSQVR